MDFVVRHRPEELESTGYMELGPGPYRGRHWQSGFLFVWEDAFAYAEGIVASHFPAYDHFEMNELPSAVAQAVAADWRRAATLLARGRVSEGVEVLALERVFPGAAEALGQDLVAQQSQIVAMLTELADGVERFASRAASVCILGM